jgi:hypothetical protein
MQRSCLFEKTKHITGAASAIETYQRLKFDLLTTVLPTYDRNIRLRTSSFSTYTRTSHESPITLSPRALNVRLCNTRVRADAWFHNDPLQSTKEWRQGMSSYWQIVLHVRDISHECRAINIADNGTPLCLDWPCG